MPIWVQLPITGFFWPFVALGIAGIMMVVLEEMEGPFGKRANAFWTTVFFLFVVYVIREHVERGYLLFPGRHWAIRDGAVITVVGGLCYGAAAIGMIIGNIGIGIFRILEAILIAIGGVVGSTARFLWKWLFGPFVRITTSILSPLAKSFRRIRWRTRQVA